MKAAVEVEWVKFRAAPVVWASTVLLLVGVGALSVASLSAADSDAPSAAKFAMFADEGWPSLFLAATQIASAAGLLAFGVVVGWSFGREFGDGTIAALFANAVPRGTIAAAKIAVYLAWVVAVAVVVALPVLALGVARGYGPVAEALPLAVTLAVTTLLTGVIALPCALAGTLGRGPLPAVATAVVLIASAQVAVLSGASLWFPFAAPALWGMGEGAGTVVVVAQLGLSVVVGVVCAAATVAVWRRLAL
jgi:ABC-2 type transport system permease protein